MLPKKRKFDLSKFDLESSSPGPSRSSNAPPKTTEAPASPASLAQPALSSASLFHIRSGGSEAASLVSLPIFAAKGLPASGFLTPETVHEAFAGTFLRTSTPTSQARTPTSVARTSPSVGVDLTQRAAQTTATLSSVGQQHSGSAFSRPPAAPHLPRPPGHAGEARARTPGTRSPMVAPKREIRPDYSKHSPPVTSYSLSSFRRDPSTTSTNVGYYMDQGKVIAVSNPDYNVERTEVISSGKQAVVTQQEYVGLNLTKPSASGYEGGRKEERRLELDLSEWVGHRVLALRGDFYYPGVIRDIVRTSDTGRDVSVLFDGDSDALSYKNVLEKTADKPPVISDAIPLTNQVSIGSKFCVKLETGRTMYAEALVYEVCRAPLQFLVKLPGSRAEGGDKQWVRRAQLRVIAAPWQEELVTAQEAPVLPLLPLPRTTVAQDPGDSS